MLLFNELHRLNKTTENTFDSTSTYYSVKLFKLSLHCIIYYSYTNTYNDNVSQSIYLQKLAMLPFLNVKSLVYLNKSCTNTLCWMGYGLTYLFLQNDNTCISCSQVIWREDCIYKSNIAIPLMKCLKAKQMISNVNQITNKRENSYRTRLP